MFVRGIINRVVPMAMAGGEGGAGGGDGGAGGEGGGDGGAGVPTLTVDMLPEAFREGDGLNTFKPFLDKPLSDFATGYAEQAKMVGNSVRLPDADATPEALAAFYGKLGRPETPDAYDFGDFKIPDGLPWNAETDKAITAKAHELGLTNTQLAGLREFYVGQRAGEHEAAAATQAKGLETAQAALKETWGGDYDANLEIAKRAAKAALGEKFDDALQMQLQDGTFLLDNPVLAEAFHKVGTKMTEPGALDGLGGGGGNDFAGMTPDGAQKEVNKIMGEAAGDPKHPYRDPTHPEHAAVQKRVLDLHKIISPGNVEG